MKLELLKEMFEKMVIPKDASLIPTYYHKDFVLFANGGQMNYQEYLVFHEEIYQTPIQYKVKYHEETFVEQENKIAGRMWITTERPHEKPQEIEVLLIAEYKDNKLYRIWELTYPDWSKLPAFENI